MERALIELKFQPYILKEYEYWTLLLNEKQRYLGRAVVWLARPGSMQRFSQLTSAELFELQAICVQYERVLNLVGWKPDHMNYAMLGNFFHEHGGHGHMHLVPRYMRSVTAHGTTFQDDRWGQNYTPETSFTITTRTMTYLIMLLRTQLAAMK